MKNKAQYLQNKEIWWRLGAELSFARSLLIKIQCDKEYQGIATNAIFGPLEQLECRIDRVRDSMENRMFAKTDFGNITAFYLSRESLKAVEGEAERARKELAALSKRFMEESHGAEGMSLEEATQNAMAMNANAMELAQAALDAENAHEKPAVNAHTRVFQRPAYPEHAHAEKRVRAA